MRRLTPQDLRARPDWRCRHFVSRLCTTRVFTGTSQTSRADADQIERAQRRRHPRAGLPRGLQDLPALLLVAAALGLRVHRESPLSPCKSL